MPLFEKKPLFKLRFLLPVLILLLFPIILSAQTENQKFFILKNWQYRWLDLKENKKAPDWSAADKTFFNNPNLNGQYLELKTTLPPLRFHEPVLFINNVDLYFETYLDDKLIYQSGKKEHKLSGFIMQMIPLPANFGGRTVLFRIYSAFNTIGINRDALLGEKSDLLSKIIHSDIDKIVLGFLFILIGFFSFFLANMHIEQKSFISFAFFNICLGVYTIVRTQIKQFLFGGDYMLWGYVELLSLYALPCGMNVFATEILRNDEKSMQNPYLNPVSWCFWMTVSFFGFTAVFSVFMPNILMDVLRIFQLMLLGNIFVLLIYTIMSSFRGNIDARIFMTGIGILCFFGIYDLLQELNLFPKIGFISHWGLFIFVLFIINILRRRIFKIHKDLELYSRKLEQDKITIKKAQYEQMMLNQEIELTQKEVIYRLSEVAEARSRETGDHVIRVAKYASLFASIYGLQQKEIDILKLAAPMHDIGKLGIPDRILNKRGKLTKSEFEKIKTHTVIGFEMLNKSKREIFSAAAIVAHQHHERYNGTGYPQKLKGKKIHIYGRIVCAADVFDSLASDRCYKKAWPFEKILEYMAEQKGMLFDPEFIEILFRYIDQFREIRDKHQEEF